MSNDDNDDGPALIIEDGQVVGGDQASDEARERGRSGSGSSGGSSSGSGSRGSVEDFDPDNYPGARTVSELGEIRRENYGLTEQERRRVDRGEDPVGSSDGQTFVSFNPSFDDPEQDEGEVVGRGDTALEATVDTQLRTGRTDTGFTERTDQREVFSGQQDRLRSRRERVQETIDEIPDAERLNLRGTELEDELGRTADRDEVVGFFEEQDARLESSVDQIETAASEFERSQRRRREAEMNRFDSDPVVRPTVERGEFEGFDAFNRVPVNAGRDGVLLGPDEESPDRFMRTGVVNPSATRIDGTSLGEQRMQQIQDGAEQPIVPDPTWTGFRVQSRIEELGDVSLSDLEGSGRRENPDELEALFGDVSAPDSVVETAGRAGRDVTELGLGSLQFGGALLRDPRGTAEDFVDSLEPTINQAPFSTAAAAEFEEEGEVSAATARMATPGDLGPTPQEQRNRLAGGGLALSALPVPGGLPRSGVGGAARTSGRVGDSGGVPVRQRTELSSDDVPDGEAVPREFLDDTGRMETGLADPVFETTEPVPGLEATGRVFDEDVRGQRRGGIETQGRGSVDELRPEERDLLRQRLEERGTAPSDAADTRRVIDDLEDIFFGDSDLMGQASLTPRTRQRTDTSDVDDFSDFLEPGTGRASENLADVGQIPQPRQPQRGRARESPARPPAFERVGLSFGLLPLQDQGQAQSQEETQLQSQDQGQAQEFAPFMDTSFAFTSRGTTASGRPSDRLVPDPDMVPRSSGPRSRGGSGVGRPGPESDSGFAGLDSGSPLFGEDPQGEFAPDFGTSIGLFEEGEEVGSDDDPATGLERRSGGNNFEDPGL